MPAPSKIDQYRLEERVLALSASGKTTHQIAEILNQDLAGRDEISQSSVSRWLKAAREETASETRSIVHEHIKATVPKDLEALDEVEAWHLAIFRGGLPEGINELIGKAASATGAPAGIYEKIISDIATAIASEIRTRSEAGMKAVRIVETKLRYSGVLEGMGESGKDLDHPANLDEIRQEIQEMKRAELRAH